MNGYAGNLVGEVSCDLGGIDKWSRGIDDRGFLEEAENLGRLRGRFYLAMSVSFL